MKQLARYWKREALSMQLKRDVYFTRKNCIMVIYVDDILIIGAKKSDLDQATSVLSRSFHMKNLKVKNLSFVNFIS